MNRTERDKHAIRAYALRYREEKKHGIIIHHVFVEQASEYSLQPVHRRHIGDIGFSVCRAVEDVKPDELLFRWKPKLATYRSNVQRVWKDFFDFFEREKEEALKYFYRKDVGKECRDVSVHEFGEYFNRFMQQTGKGRSLVQCIPEVGVLYSGIENELEFPTLFETRNNSRAK